MGAGHVPDDNENREREDDENEDPDTDDGDVDSDDGFSIIQDPSTDIRGDLENVIGDLDFKGSIAFSHTYDDSPNPGLRLDGLGAVGLPLNTREAKAVIEHCVQAPFGKGERTVVDKDVRDTWEMDAIKVHFDNPAWAKFLQRILNDVCQALGVNIAASKPRCELYKLLLYETGSHFLAHVDSEKANGMFASVIVVLPSPFTGGDAHLSHGGQTMVLNSSRASALQTTVLAWYTDIMHEVKPINSGYRLALAYNLVHTTTSLRPSLADTTSSVARLRHVMLSWKQSKDNEDAPDWIVIELDHQYSAANLSASALKGLDAHKVAILDEVAMELGMCLGLAHLEHHISGCADDDGGGYYRRRHCYYDEPSDDDDVGMLEVYERSTSITGLVDMDGHLLSRDVDFDDSESLDAIPKDFVSMLEEGSHDEQDYEGYMGNGAGSLDRYYRRTVLLVWPRGSSLGSGGDRRAAYSLDRLRESCNKDFEPQDLTYFFNVLKSRQVDAFAVLCAVARQWSRLDLWQQVIITQHNKNVIREIFDSVSVFGFDPIRPSMEQFLQTRSLNSQRIGFIEQMKVWAAGQTDPILHASIVDFIREQMTWILENIRQPLDDEVSVLTNEACMHGGLMFFKETMLPQVQKLASKKVLEAFAETIYRRREELMKTIEDGVILTSVVGELLNKAVDLADFLPATPTASYYTRQQISDSTTTREQSFALIKKCIEYDQVPIAARAIARVADAASKIPADHGDRVVSVLLPLVALLAAEVKSHTPPLPLSLDAVSDAAIRAVMESALFKSGALPKDYLDAMLAAASVNNNRDILGTLILPRIKAVDWKVSQLKTTIEQLHARSIDATFNGESLLALKQATIELTAVYASKVDILAAPSYSYYDVARVTTAGQIGAAVDFCLGMGGIGCLKIVLDRVLGHKPLTKDYISQTLILIPPLLRQSASKNQVSLATEPFTSTLRTIVRLWLQHVLGPKPDEQASKDVISALSRWTCPCAHCTRVIAFIKQDPNKELSLDRIGAPNRKHVERYMNSYARGAASYDTIRTTPQGLKVVKNEVVVAPSRWKANQEIGLRVLKQLGNKTDLDAIFGNEYPGIISALHAGEQLSVVRRPKGAKARPSEVTQGAAASKPAPAVPVTPAKRKSTVIDLCTP